MLHSSRIRVSVVALMAVVSGCELGDPPTESVPGGSEGFFFSDVFGLGAPEVGGPLRFLHPEQRRLFERGSTVFQIEFTPEAGLGPLFNSVGCANCHEVPVVGGGGEIEEEPGGVPGEDIEVHATAFQNGACNDLTAQGGSVFQKQVTDALRAALGIDHEEPPAGASIANRTTPDLFGFGLLDAVPDGLILSLADPDDRNGDGISGRPNRFFDGRLGRFGRKALIPTLDEFTSGALVLEMGITNPGFPIEESPGGAPLPTGVDPLPEPEIGQADLDAVSGFVRFLAPPRPLVLGRGGREGLVLFSRIGCASCHVPALRTGRTRERVLSNRVVFAYTDLLLHDMGPELADICLGDAQPSEFRTEPLMGLRFATSFLHDGRAATIEEAVLAHGGEAQRARDRFAGLSLRARSALLAFLSSL